MKLGCCILFARASEALLFSGPPAWIQCTILTSAVDFRPGAQFCELFRPAIITLGPDFDSFWPTGTLWPYFLAQLLDTALPLLPPLPPLPPYFHYFHPTWATTLALGASFGKSTLYVLGFGANFTKSTSYPLGWVTWPRLGPTLVISPPQVPNPAPTLVNPPSLTLVSAPTLLPWALACHHPLLWSVDDDDDHLQSFELDTTGRGRQNDGLSLSS